MPVRRLKRLCLTALLIATGLSPVMTGSQLASRPASDWIDRLERPERVAELKIDEILAKLRLTPGTVVADLGAGAGTLTLPLAKAVSPGGKVYAVDIDQQFLDHIRRKSQEQKVTNTIPVLGKYSDPNLPAKDVDVALFHDVLHHIEDRAGYLKNLAPYMKRSGRIAIVELDPLTGGHRDDPKLQLSKEQVTAWLAEIGFKPAEKFNLFKDKWFVVYARQ